MFCAIGVTVSQIYHIYEEQMKRGFLMKQKDFCFQKKTENSHGKQGGRVDTGYDSRYDDLVKPVTGRSNILAAEREPGQVEARQRCGMQMDP